MMRFQMAERMPKRVSQQDVAHVLWGLAQPTRKFSVDFRSAVLEPLQPFGGTFSRQQLFLLFPVWHIAPLLDSLLIAGGTYFLQKFLLYPE